MPLFQTTTRMLWAAPMSPMRKMMTRGATVSNSPISGPPMKARCPLPETAESVHFCCARNDSVNGQNSSLSYVRTGYRQAYRQAELGNRPLAFLSFLSLQWCSQSSSLQCYKTSKDTCPYVDLLLPQCTVVYAPKDSKRKHHELRFTLPNGDALVLAVQSKEQAHRWLRVSATWNACMEVGRGEGLAAAKITMKMSSQVVREVSSQSAGPDESTSPVIPRKTELDKVGVNLIQAGSCHFGSRIIATDRWDEEKH